MMNGASAETLALYKFFCNRTVAALIRYRASPPRSNKCNYNISPTNLPAASKIFVRYILNHVGQLSIGLASVPSALKISLTEDARRIRKTWGIWSLRISSYKSKALSRYILGGTRGASASYPYVRSTARRGVSTCQACAISFAQAWIKLFVATGVMAFDSGFSLMELLLFQ